MTTRAGRKRKVVVTLAPHDRRATDLLRNAQVGVIEVDDPLAIDPGDKIVVLRSLRDDHLGRLHDRKQIDDAQYRGGRAYQRDWETAERGPRAVDPSKEHVDGGCPREPLTDGQRRAVVNLNRADKALGQKGIGLTQDVLIHGLTMEQVAQKRSQTPSSFTMQFFGWQVREHLETLAMVYGYVMKARA